MFLIILFYEIVSRTADLDKTFFNIEIVDCALPDFNKSVFY